MADLVTLAEAKAYVGVIGFDDLLASLISQSSAIVENFTERRFDEQTDFVEDVDGGFECLRLSNIPVTDIGSIKDRELGLAVVPTTAYEVISASGLIYPVVGALGAAYSPWPSGKRRWRVTYDYGYTDVPDDIKIAALTIIAEWFANREGKPSEGLGDHTSSWSPSAQLSMPPRAEAILSRYRRVLN